MTKNLKKMYSWKIVTYFSIKDVQSYRRSLQPSKENIQHFITWNFLTLFSIFVGNFCPSGPGFGSTDLIESGLHPKHCLECRLIDFLLLVIRSKLHVHVRPRAGGRHLWGGGGRVRERALRQRRDLHRPAGRLRMRLPARLHGQELPGGRERVRELALPARILLRPGESWPVTIVVAAHEKDPNVQFDHSLAVFRIRMFLGLLDPYPDP